MTDTIYALSSGALPSGVAVVRVSGPRACDVATALAGALPVPRQAQLKVLRDRSGSILDQAIVLRFAGPESFTGEDIVEFHLHGGRAVVGAVCTALGSFATVRPAEAGEFSRRAYLNGKFDLVTAEALADLIDAETEAQRRLAIENASGVHAELFARWRTSLLAMRALVEAGIDFSDEGDVDPAEVTSEISALAGELRGYLGGARAKEIIRDGFRVVITGRPNAGKSSLLNVLARRDAAIVTPEAGTTRDIIEVSMDLSGHKVVLVDTAGIREAESEPERQGVERSVAQIKRADLVLLLDEQNHSELEIPARTGRVLNVRTKIDLGPRDGGDDAQSVGKHDFVISVRTGQGIDALVRELGKRAAQSAGSGGLAPFRDRQERHVVDALCHVGAALSASADELRAEELRCAADCIGRITGAISTEDVLGEIFSRFCIGK